MIDLSKEKIKSKVLACRKKCCPHIHDTEEGDIIIGEPFDGKYGEYTKMSRQSFKELIENARAGKFDHFICN